MTDNITDSMINGVNEPVGIGAFLNASGKTFLPASQEEIDRTDQFVSRTLSTFHFRTGGHILVISMLDMWVQFMPLERGAMDYGLVVCSADDSPWDAARVESIMRRFDVSAVAAVSNDCLNGLEQLGHDPAAVFGDAVVWAYPDACARLDKSNVHRFMQLGPAIAMECGQKDGLHIDHFEWNVESVDGELQLSSKMPRAMDFKRFATGIRGEVEQGICGCGNTDPRIRLS
jgi:hypothetical protein